MNGKTHTIPFAMLFKRYFCAHCGTKLGRERTHRVVTKDDPDYYQYHKRGQFPRYDHDVYEYRFQCPSCGARTTFEDQCMIALLQKKHGSCVLSSAQLRENAEERQKARAKSVLLREIGAAVLFSAVFCCLFYLVGENRSQSRLWTSVGMFVFLTVISAVGSIKRHKGVALQPSNRAYSYEKESLLKHLHTYSSHNRKWVDTSMVCHCFSCKRQVPREDVVRFIDDGQTALCPICGVDALLPDGIDEPLDEVILSEMHEYWF